MLKKTILVLCAVIVAPILAYWLFVFGFCVIMNAVDFFGNF